MTIKPNMNNKLNISTLQKLITKYDPELVDPTDIAAVKHLLAIDLYIITLANVLQYVNAPVGTPLEIDIPIQSTGVDEASWCRDDEDPVIKNALYKLRSDCFELVQKQLRSHPNTEIDDTDFWDLLDDFGELTARGIVNKIVDKGYITPTSIYVEDGMLCVR